MRIFAAAMLVGMIAPLAQSQSTNIDFSDAAGLPASAYGVLGVAGAWNAVNITAAAPMVFDAGVMSDTVGNAGPTLRVFRTASGFTQTCPPCAASPFPPAGDPRAMFGDDLNIGNFGDASLNDDTAFEFTNLENGIYDLYIYGYPATVNFGNGFRAWINNDTLSTQSLLFPQSAAGTFPAPTEGLTHLRFQNIEVTGNTLTLHTIYGDIPIMPGDVPLHLYLDGAFLNGIQLVKVAPAPCPGDANNDQVVDVDDLNIVLSNWNTNGPLGDLDQSGTVDVDDLNAVLGAWNAMCP